MNLNLKIENSNSSTNLQSPHTFMNNPEISPLFSLNISPLNTKISNKKD